MIRICLENSEHEKDLTMQANKQNATTDKLSSTSQHLEDKIKQLEDEYKQIHSELRNVIRVQESRSRKQKCQGQGGNILWFILILILVPVNLSIAIACHKSQNEVWMLESQLEQAINSINATCTNNSLEVAKLKESQLEQAINSINATYNSLEVRAKLKKSHLEQAIAINSINATCTNNSLEIRAKLKEYSFQLELVKYSVVSENKYFEDLSKILQGIEWRHKWLNSEQSREGQIFYLGLYRVRIFLKFQYSKEWEDYTASYYLKRLEGAYDEAIAPCRVKYSYYAYVDQDNEDNLVEWGSEFNTPLHVGSKFYICSVAKSKISRFLKDNRLLFRVYFDIS